MRCQHQLVSAFFTVSVQEMEAAFISSARDPETCLEVHARISELVRNHVRRRLLQDAVYRREFGKYGSARLVNGCFVGNGDRNDEASIAIRRMVDEHVIDYFLVRDDDVLIILRTDASASHRYEFNAAIVLADGDIVANAERLIEENEEAGDDVRERILRSEASSESDDADAGQRSRDIDSQLLSCRMTMKTKMIVL
jgi:hypothetical protein